MSTITVRVTTIRDVRPHPNADALELATIEGWQVVVRKETYREGQPVVYFEPGTVIPPDVAGRFAVTQYLHEKTDIHGDRVLVVHRVKLRGEPSFGLVVVPDQDWPIGTDVTTHYGATKFYPPVKMTAGDAEVDHPQFAAYTDIENLRSYPNVLQAGEEVEATEKIHGTNSRVGFVADEVDGQRQMVFMAGSRSLRRKPPVWPNGSPAITVLSPDAPVLPADTDRVFAQNTYWSPLALAPVQQLLEDLFADGVTSAVLYGEVFGQKIQAYDYGQGKPTYRAFDLAVNGVFLDADTFARICDRWGVARVPVVYRGPYDLATIKALSDGPSQVGGTHGREGVVVRPVRERFHPTVGRVILKYVGDQYLFGKAAQSDTTDQ